MIAYKLIKSLGIIFTIIDFKGVNETFIINKFKREIITLTIKNSFKEIKFFISLKYEGLIKNENRQE